MDPAGIVLKQNRSAFLPLVLKEKAKITEISIASAFPSLSVSVLKWNSWGTSDMSRLPSAQSIQSPSHRSSLPFMPSVHQPLRIARQRRRRGQARSVAVTLATLPTGPFASTLTNAKLDKILTPRFGDFAFRMRILVESVIWKWKSPKMGVRYVRPCWTATDCEQLGVAYREV